MGRVLMMLEVSRKQDYIFANRKLSENVRRSQEISHVTDSGFFEAEAGDLYSEAENLVYTGGGHTVLQFPDAETARAFGQRVSEAALRTYDGMEMFVQCLPFDEQSTPEANLTALTEALERKKALRKASFRQLSAGVEALDAECFQPLPLKVASPHPLGEPCAPPEGCAFPREFSELAGDDPFIAVIHIDGNAMGKRVQQLYAREGRDWEACRQSLQRFSTGIQADFEQAFRETAAVVAGQRGISSAALPIRPLILAGDDVCFVTAGRTALECARVFLERLRARVNAEDKKPYAACAGVAIVHTKYPFHLAYGLSEELCGSAKRFGASLDPDGRVCAMDWHIEFGQLKDGLSAIREDYETEDGNCLELRPLVVAAPEDADLRRTGGVREWAFFRAMCMALQGEYGSVARSKIKQLRTAFKQGEVESRFFLQEKMIHDLLYHVADASHLGDEARRAWYRKLLTGDARMENEAFRVIDGVKRCLFFDALELMDNCDFYEEVRA